MSHFVHKDKMPEWAAQIPKSWGTNWLKWSVDLSTKRPTKEEKEALPYISNEDIASWTGRLVIKEPKPTDADCRTFRRNDVLFNKLRPYLAKAHHARFDGVCSGELLCLRSSKFIEPKFLFYVLVSKGFIDTINAETFGAKMPRADWGIVGHQPLPIPPLDTQRRIVRFLDEKIGRVDTLVEKKWELLKHITEKRQTLLAKFITKGLNLQIAMKPSGVDWIGNIPAHWYAAPLNRIIRIKSGEHIAASDICKNYGNHLVFGGNGVRGFAENFNTIGPIVIIGRQGAHCGNVQVAHGKVWASEHALRCFPEKKFEMRWLAYMLEIMDLNQYSVSAAQPGLSVDNLKNIRTIFPPLDEQRLIANQLDEILGRHEKIKRKIRNGLKFLKECRSAVITAAITGQIAELR